MKKVLYYLLALLMVINVSLFAETIISETLYESDFSTDRSADFWGFDSSGAHKSYIFGDGVAISSARYAQESYISLVVSGYDATSYIDGSTYTITTLDDSSVTCKGSYTNVYAEVTYNLYASGSFSGQNHSNITFKLKVRATDDPIKTGNLESSYYASYDGQRFAIYEYYDMNQGKAPRELAGTNISASATDSDFKVVINVQGGHDDFDTYSNGTAATITAEFWEDGVMLASLSGVDNPWNWTTGPEIDGTVFDAAGDYGNGTWTPAIGDWNGAQSHTRADPDNYDIRMGGLVILESKPFLNTGSYEGISIKELIISDDKPSIPGTIIVIQ